MPKIITLSESDLNRIIKRVINEKTNPGKVVSVKDKNVTGVPYGGEGVYSGKGYYNTKGQFILHGYGKMKFKDNESYDGNWKNGYPDGYGKLINDNGSSYRGYWKEGYKEGYGVYTNIHNIEFPGNFEDGWHPSWKTYDELNKIKTKPKTPNQPQFVIQNNYLFKSEDGSATGVGDGKEYATKNNDGSISIGDKRFTYKCEYGNYLMKDGKKWYDETNSKSKGLLINTIRSKFCSGKPISSVDGKKQIETKPKPKTDTRCKFTEMSFQAKNLCKLPNDKVWSYVKTDDGKWYTSKQSDMKKWCELTPSKFSKAIDILTKGCKTTEVIPSLKLKPIGPIQMDKKLEITPSNQEMMNKGMEGLENIQDFQNQPV